MRSVLNPTISEVVASAHYRPAISLIIPFDPKMNGHAALTIALKNACRKIEKQLLLEYPADTVVLMMEKLSTIIAQLNYNTHKKSIAIFVSPVFEKVIYLDILVEEKIAIDDSFEIRDLLYSKKQLHKYLLLQLSAGQVRMFIGNSSSFVKIVSHAEMPQQLPARDLPERVGKFSDVHAAHEKQLDKFLRQVEDSLELILRAYPLPLYIIGPEKLLGHFKKMTAHNGEVIEYIHGDYQHAAEKELSEILAPHVADWKSVLEKDIRNKMEQALSAGRMVSGIEEV
ncbi:MAG TPA: hypothetical protein VL307_08965, partial [Chitinophagaceae bacterium]|nr:hypothetical protein [Chitinophagaceae bacterium]